MRIRDGFDVGFSLQRGSGDKEEYKGEVGVGGGKGWDPVGSFERYFRSTDEHESSLLFFFSLREGNGFLFKLSLLIL